MSLRICFALLNYVLFCLFRSLAKQIRQLALAHNALAEEEHDDHDDDREYDHAEAIAQQRHLERADIRLVVQEAQPPLGAGDVQEGGDAAAGDRADTADDDDEQDLIGHGRGKDLGLHGRCEHRKERAGHAREKRADDKGQALVLFEVHTHGLRRDLIIADGLERAAVGGVDEQDDDRDADADDHERHERVRKIREAAQQLRDILEPLHPADIAWVLEALPLDDRLAVWNQVQSESDGDILLEVNEGVRETLIEAMDRDELVDAVETLDTDQIADLVDDLPPDVMAEVQEGLSHEERAQLRAAMSYPEDSVGARMDFEMVSIREEVTIDMVLRYLRRFKELPDHMDQIFVVDRLGRLKGALAVAQILTSDPAKQVRRIMQTETFTLNPLDDASDAAQAFERYDLVSAAVVDEAGRLVGRLTVNEVVDVIREESDEDAFSAVGLDDEQDLFGSVWGAAKSRWLWLGVNLCTAFFASRVISAFDGTIERVVALAALMPIVAGMAGNSGNQTLTLLVRSLATGQVTLANTIDIWKKELAVAVVNGLLWGAIAGLCAWALYWDSPQGHTLGLVMALAMFLNIVQGAAVGLAVPLILNKMGRDPAMGGSVLLTFTTDSGGFLIFLGLATIFFR